MWLSTMRIINIEQENTFMGITSVSENILPRSFSDRQTEAIYHISFNTHSKKVNNNVFFLPCVKMLIEKINFTNIISHFRLTNNLDVFNIQAYLFLLR